MIPAAIGIAQSSIRSARQFSLPSLTLFCDFDGPIVDVSDRYYHTYQIGLAEIQGFYRQQGICLPIHCLDKEQFWQMKQERTPDPEIALRSGLQGGQINQFLDRVKEIVNRPDLLHQDQIQPGVKWALALLASQGVRLVLVTLRQQSQARQMLRSYGVDGLFSSVWGAEDDHAAYLNQSDHKTQLLQQAMAYSHRDGMTQSWMVGDTEADIVAGQAMGIPTIALTCGIRSNAYLQKFGPSRIHTDLLSAAHYLTQLLATAA